MYPVAATPYTVSRARVAFAGIPVRRVSCLAGSTVEDGFGRTARNDRVRPVDVFTAVTVIGAELANPYSYSELSRIWSDID